MTTPEKQSQQDEALHRQVEQEWTRWALAYVNDTQMVMLNRAMTDFIQQPQHQQGCIERMQNEYNNAEQAVAYFRAEAYVPQHAQRLDPLFHQTLGYYAQFATDQENIQVFTALCIQTLARAWAIHNAITANQQAQSTLASMQQTTPQHIINTIPPPPETPSAEQTS